MNNQALPNTRKYFGRQVRSFMAMHASVIETPGAVLGIMWLSPTCRRETWSATACMTAFMILGFMNPDTNQVVQTLMDLILVISGPLLFWSIYNNDVLRSWSFKKVGVLLLCLTTSLLGLLFYTIARGFQVHGQVGHQIDKDIQKRFGV